MIELREVDRKLLELLSENPRIKVAELSRKLKITRNRTKKKLERLEKELGIKYVLEINEEKLGFGINFISKVKLKKPIDEKLLKKILSKSYIPQFVAITKGDFDLFIYGHSEDTEIYDKWEVVTREKLYEYIDEWNGLVVTHKRFGFFTMSKEIMEKIKLSKNERKILEVLDDNSRTTIKEIAKRTKLSKPLIKFYMNKMKKKNLYKERMIFSVGTSPIQTILLRDISISPDSLRKTNEMAREFIYSNIKNITFASKLMGEFNHCIITSFENIEKNYNFQTKLREINKDRVKKESSALIIKTIIGNQDINLFKTTKWKVVKYF